MSVGARVRGAGAAASTLGASTVMAAGSGQAPRGLLSRLGAVDAAADAVGDVNPLSGQGRVADSSAASP
jgi:ABC-type hemin transport system substrate-binding protein